MIEHLLMVPSPLLAGSRAGSPLLGQGGLDALQAREGCEGGARGHGGDAGCNGN